MMRTIFYRSKFGGVIDLSFDVAVDFFKRVVIGEARCDHLLTHILNRVALLAHF